jgi:hypothetical protein
MLRIGAPDITAVFINWPKEKRSHPVPLAFLVSFGIAASFGETCFIGMESAIFLVVDFSWKPDSVWHAMCLM